MFDPPRRDYDPARPPLYRSRILGENRRVRVYLPAGYRQNRARRYPVLYCQDGQNMFEHGAYGTWTADDTLARLSGRGIIQDLIVVAADHGPGRHQDYMPPEDGGRCDLYARFLVEELKPRIDRRYRTLTEARHTGILGSSLGAVAALYTAWRHPDVFGLAASMSGSWWLRHWRQALTGRPELRIYLDSGDSGHARDCVQHTRELADRLLRLGFQADLDLKHHVARHHVHTESAWGRRLHLPLRFLFPAAVPGLQVA